MTPVPKHSAATILAALAFAAGARAAEPPSPADDAYQVAANLFAEKRYTEAAEAYSAFPKAHADDKRVAEASFMAAESLFREGDLPASLKTMAALRADARAAFREANILYLLGRPADALPHLQKLVGRKGLPASLAGPAHYFLAKSLAALGKIDEARKAIAAAPKPTTKPARAYLAAALGDVEAAAFLAPEKKGGGNKKHLAAALAAYRNAVAGGGAIVPDALFKMGELLRRAGKPREAIPYYKRAANDFASNPIAPHARLGLAWSALGAGDSATAAVQAALLRKEIGDGADALATEARFAEGTALLAAGKYAQAATVLEPLTKLKPTETSIPRARVLRRTAWAAVAAGRKDLATRAAAGLLALKLPPARAAEARLLAAEAELASGNPGEAIAHLDKVDDALNEVVNENDSAPPLDALATYRRAVALDMKGDDAAAAAAFAAFLQKYPKHRLVPWAAALAGRACLSGGKPADAATCFKMARKLFRGRPEESEILWGSVVAEYRMGNLVSMAGFARRLIKGHPTSPRAADAAYWLGWWHLERGEFARAAERFGDAVGLAGKAGRAKLAATAMLEAASALKRAGDAAGALLRAKELVTGPFAAHVPPEAVLWVAEALRDSGKADEAQRVLDQSLARIGEGPGRARLIYALGELARVKGRIDPALALFEKAIAANPTPDLRAAALLGKARCLVAKGRRREVEVILQNVIDRTAGWPRAAAYVELGKLRLEEASALEREERTALAERAARDFMQVVVLYVPDEPGEGARLSAQALVGAARAYALLGRYVTARDRLEQLLAEALYRAGPDGTETPEAIEARKLLEEVGLKASEMRSGPTGAEPANANPPVGKEGAR
jgi:TolA-binding protein